MNGMTRGELAKQCGVNPETVRYYEQNGLLPLPARSESGYRLFDERASQRIRFIKRAQAAGFTLEEIRELLAIQSSPHGTTGAVRGMVDDKLADIEARIAALMSIKHTLLHLRDDCPGGDAPVSECPILHSFQTTGEMNMEQKTFTVPNIGCNGCVATIKNEVSALTGVQRVEGVVDSKTVTVEWDAPATWAQIQAKLEEIEYAPAS
jgi:DNA-binding transcriptional MerR regulator/copper chaperone CopZ